MTATNTSAKAPATPAGGASSDSKADATPAPQPWTRQEDREGWQFVARGQRRKDRPPVGTALFVELNREQAAWVESAAEAGGVSQVELVLQLIDAARRSAVPG